MVTAFTGVDGEKLTIMANEARVLSHSLWFVAAGLAIGIVSFFAYRRLRSALNEMRGEMHITVLGLMNVLMQHVPPSRSLRASPAVDSRLGPVERAATRTVANIKLLLRSRLAWMNTIAATAPWIGILGLICSFNGTLKSFSDSRDLIDVTGSLVPCALGLMTSAFAMAARNYLITTSEDMEVEMRIASLDLMNALSLVPSGRKA
jgi:biopolymer transport protein ExbB/TolQ